VEPKKKPPATPRARARAAAGKAPVKPGPGGRTTLNLTKLEKIVTALRGGAYIVTACQFAGVAEATYHKWRARGEVELDRVDSLPRVNLEALFATFDGDDPNAVDDKTGKPLPKSRPAYMWHHPPRQFDKYEWPYALLAHMAEIARAEAEVRAVSTIMAAGQKSWQAHAWFLERTRPERYGQKSSLALGGTEDGAPIRTENKNLVTVSELDAALGQLIDQRKKTRGRRDD
jgi:hypothetical protein